MVNFIISKKIFQDSLQSKKTYRKIFKIFNEKIIILYITEYIEEFFSKLIRHFLIVKNKAYS